MLARRYEEAIGLYRRLLRVLPDEPGVRLNLGLALHSASRYREAIAQLEQIRAPEAANPRFWFILGLSYLKCEEPRKAIAPLEKALELDASNATARLELADAYLESGQFALAAGSFKRLAEEKPDLPKAWQGIALSELALSHADLAKKALDRLAALPPSAEQHEMLAIAYGRTGKRAESVAEWREAVRLAPGDKRLQGRLAEELWLSRQYDEARPILESLVRGDPERPDWQFELGDTLFSQGEPEEALTHLQEAVTLAPAMLPARAVLGKALLRTGNPSAAIPHLERALEIDKDGSLHFQLATAYRKIGKPDVAERVLQRTTR